MRRRSARAAAAWCPTAGETKEDADPTHSTSQQGPPSKHSLPLLPLLLLLRRHHQQRLTLRLDIDEVLSLLRVFVPSLLGLFTRAP